MPSIVKHTTQLCFTFFKCGQQLLHTIPALKTRTTLLFSLIFYFNSTFAQGKHDFQIADSLNQLAWDLVESNPPRSKAIVKQVLEQTLAIKYDAGQAFALNTCGVLDQNDGNYDEAEEYFFASLNLRLQLGDSSLIASAYHNLGSVKDNKGEYVEAIEYVMLAIKIWDNLKDEAQLGKAYNTMAGIYESNDNDEDAIRYTMEGLKKLKKTEDWEAIADTEYNLGRRYYELLSDFDLAKQHYNNALELLETKVDNKYTYSSTLNGLAVIEMENGAFERAEQYFNQALEKARSVNDILGIFDIYCNLSWIYETSKDYPNALYFLKEAEQVLGEKGGLEDRQYLYEQYANVYKALGDYQNAFDNLNLADSLDNELMSNAKAKQIARMEAEFENALLEKEAERAKFSRNVFIGIAGLLSLVLFFVWLWFRQRRKNVKIQHQQEIDELIEGQERKFMDAYFEGQEEEKKKYADQLHTHFGGLLVAAKWDYEGLLEEMRQEGSEWVQKLQIANTKLQNAYDEVRDKSHEFGTKRLEKKGLITALNDLCQTISANGRLNAIFNSFGLEERLDAKTEIAVYRIVQELITNVLKHANAKNLTVQVNPVDHILSIMVEDDGEGFDYDNDVEEGMGLLDITARAENLGGTIDVDTNRGGGTTVIVDIPLKLKNNSTPSIKA